MPIWFCAALGERVSKEQPDQDRGIVSVETNLSPFGVIADNYHEAVGKATEVMEKVKKTCPGYTRWVIQVNRIPDQPVSDTEKATVDPPKSV